MRVVNADEPQRLSHSTVSKRLQKLTAKEFKNLSKRFGVDGDSILKTVDIDRDGKLSPAEMQNAIRILQKAVVAKQEPATPVDFGPSAVVKINASFGRQD